MRIRVLLFVSFILLLLLSSCGAEGNRGNNRLTITPTSTPVLYVIDSTIPGIKIETIYPAHMIVNQSYVIAVLLVSQTGAPPDFKTLENATMVVTQPTPVGTPGATVGQAFGAGLEPFANATLNSGSFKVLSAPSNEQSLRVPMVEWDWNVTPQSTGTQIFSVGITIKWILTQSGFVPFVPQFGIGNPQVSVTVTDAPAHPVAPSPFFTLGQINLGNLITALVGSGVLGGLILGIWKSRKKNQTTPSKTPNSPPATPSGPPAKTP